MPLIIVFALAGEVVGIGGSQVVVGAGMGAGIGLMQSKLIRKVVRKSVPWFWGTLVGFALPFLAYDISNAMGWGIGFSLPLFVAIGGTVAGAGQVLMLHLRLPGMLMWIAASAVGWGA